MIPPNTPVSKVVTPKIAFCPVIKLLVSITPLAIKKLPIIVFIVIYPKKPDNAAVAFSDLAYPYAIHIAKIIEILLFTTLPASFINWNIREKKLFPKKGATSTKLAFVNALPTPTRIPEIGKSKTGAIRTLPSF